MWAGMVIGGSPVLVIVLVAAVPLKPGAKVIVSSVRTVPFASWMASRSEHTTGAPPSLSQKPSGLASPTSPVLLTTKSAWATGATSKANDVHNRTAASLGQGTCPAYTRFGCSLVPSSA